MVENESISTQKQCIALAARLLLANTYGSQNDHLLHPCLIDTYRDLFRNVGFEIETEEIFRGVKDGVEMKVLMSLFVKPPGRSRDV